MHARLNDGDRQGSFMESLLEQLRAVALACFVNKELNWFIAAHFSFRFLTIKYFTFI
jgi:hypothetical protein